ncbi:uncharacterized protein G2W53_009479 [Senna tora]|uniref:Secreted protein n=1 Tax=Senna tora TaxID=362788 RepID=A0A834WXK1_9FABA|nr:uncharacterized protein G2W53_009479 [Senna tora]
MARKRRFTQNFFFLMLSLIAKHEYKPCDYTYDTNYERNLISPKIHIPMLQRVARIASVNCHWYKQTLNACQSTSKP